MLRRDCRVCPLSAAGIRLNGKGTSGGLCQDLPPVFVCLTYGGICDMLCFHPVTVLHYSR